MQNIDREKAHLFSEKYKFWEVRDDENVPLCNTEDGQDLLEQVDSCAGLYTGVVIIFSGGKKDRINQKKFWLPLEDNAKPPKQLGEVKQDRDRDRDRDREPRSGLTDKTFGYVQGLQKEVFTMQQQTLAGQMKANEDMLNKHMEALTIQTQAQAQIANAKLDAEIEKQKLQNEFQKLKFDFELEKRDELAKIDKIREQAQRELEEAKKAKEKYELKLEKLEDKEEERKANKDIVLEGIMGIGGKALASVGKKIGIDLDIDKGLNGIFAKDEDEDEEADSAEEEEETEEEAQTVPADKGGINFENIEEL